MGARYPDQVGGHKPCVPVVVKYGSIVPVWDRFWFATMVVVDAFGRHGATQD